MEPVPPRGSHATRQLSAGDASQILKEMLNVGKPQSQTANHNSAPLHHSGASAAAATAAADGGSALTSQVGRGEGDVMGSKPPPQPASVQNLLPDAQKLSELMSIDGKISQLIELEGDDRKGSVSIYGSKVEITPSYASVVDSSIPGSSKVKITPVVNYDWEAKYYYGNLVAVNNTFLVYVLKIQSGYGLRILNRRSTVRALLKGFSCVICDIAFAFHNADILGCIDQRGNFSVWLITEEGGKIMYEPKIQVLRDLPPSDFHRLVWCPYLPDDVSEDDMPSEWSNLVAISHDDVAELWDIAVVASEHSTEKILSRDVSNGVIKVEGHEKPITDMAVSPDGSVLASASMDGTVRFWQLYWEVDDPPRCLHQFSPHEAKPVTSLLFCDNHKYQDASLAFWRFLITGAEFNRELKVWCTVQWTCLQRLRFDHSPTDPQPSLKVKLDLSASFLMATDIKRKVLYVIQLYQEHDKGMAHFSSLTEFLLMQPMLSFAIVDAGRCRPKRALEEAEDGEELETGEFEEVSPETEDGGGMDNGQPVSVLVKMFCVFSRALQELQIRFQPSPSIGQDVRAGSINTTTSHGENSLHDGLSDVSFSATDRSVASTDTEAQPVYESAPSSTARSSDPVTPSAETSSFTSESTHSSQPYLMTPESLMNSSRSPTKTTPTQQLPRPLGGSCSAPSTPSSSFTQVTGTNVSVDDLLSSCGTSEILSASAGATPDSTKTLTPTPAGGATHTSPHLVNECGHSAVKSYAEIREVEEEERPDEPKSPPPSPIGGNIQDLQGDQLLGSSESVAELLQKSSRLKEKRVSDSSAEVAQILGENVEEEDEDEEEEEEEEGDDDVMETDMNQDNNYGQASPVVAAKAVEVVNGTKVEDSGSLVQDANSQSQVDDAGYRQPIRFGENQREARQPGEGLDLGIQHQDLGRIMGSLEQMMSLLQTQQQEIRHLRQEMNKAQLSNSIIQSTKARIDKLEKGLGTKLDTMFAKQSEQERQRLTAALQEKTNLDKQKQERLLETVTQTLRQQVTSRLDKTVRSEMEAKVVPELHRVLNPVTEQMNSSIAHKLTATDQLMKENIHKLVKSKGVADTMGQAAAGALSATIQNTYREAFQSTVMPAFERACTSMFEQINASFDAGTREYVNQLESNLAEFKQKQKEGQDPVLRELRSASEAQKTSVESMRTSLFEDLQGEISEQLHLNSEKLKKDLLESTQNLVQTEITAALEKQQASLQEDVMAALRSQAPTPVPPAQDAQYVQAKIKQLLEQKQINAAFQHALNASDLRVVVFTCSEVTPDTIFSDDGCLLEQPVLLSLIQQLSQDLGTQTRIKCTYIDEALLAVDTTYPVTREHLSGIITELCRQITLVQQTQPNHPQAKQLRRVLMQAQSLK